MPVVWRDGACSSSLQRALRRVTTPMPLPSWSAGKSRATLEWRRDPAADEAARTRATALCLPIGVTLDDAVNIAFLIHPSLQIALEQLAISAPNWWRR